MHYGVKKRRKHSIIRVMKKERPPHPVAKQLGEALIEGAYAQFPTRGLLAEGLDAQKSSIIRYGQGTRIPRPDFMCRYYERIQLAPELYEKITSTYATLVEMELVSNDVGDPSQTTRRIIDQQNKEKGMKRRVAGEDRRRKVNKNVSASVKRRWNESTEEEREIWMSNLKRGNKRRKNIPENEDRISETVPLVATVEHLMIVEV